MSRIRLIHWNGPEGRERQLRLASLGHHVEFDAQDGPALLRTARANPPDAFVIDLSRLPSHGREVALALRTYKDTRHVPLVLVDGEPAKVAAIRALLPDARYTTWGRLKSVLPKAIAASPANPVVPASPIASTRPTADKLGIKAGFTVALVSAPPGFAGRLRPRPPKVTFTARPEPSCDLVVCFVGSTRELTARLDALRDTLDRQTLWIAWRKKASGAASDVVDSRLRRLVGSGPFGPSWAPASPAVDSRLRRLVGSGPFGPSWAPASPACARPSAS
jgi:CheY-like chemotaxis protein